MSQMKRLDKTLKKQLSEVEIGKLPGKRIQNNDREDDPRSQENYEEDVYQRPTRTKEQRKTDEYCTRKKSIAE